MKKLLLPFFLSVFCSAQAQTIRLEGSIVADSLQANMGNFIIYSLPDSSLIKGGYLDSTATFSSVFKPDGKKDFYIKIRAFEYKDTLVNFSLNGDTVVTLNPIVLNKNRNLNKIDIVYIKPEFERTMDGIKVNVEGTNLQTLNTLFDVLVASPKLTSPDNERIEIIGKGSPLILVDRQAIISNDELKAIPANMVESIEIITNPSAKYRAQGRGGGVIEVYTKNFHLEGYNMTISSSGGINTQVKPTSRLNLGLNLKRGKFSLNGYLGGNYQQSNSFGSSGGNSTDDSNRSLESEFESDNWSSWQYYNLKGAYQFNKRHKLSAGVRGHGSIRGNESIGSTEYLNGSVTETSNSYTQDSRNTWLNNSGFVNYVWETDTNRSALEINLNITGKSSNNSSTKLSTYENTSSGEMSDFEIQSQSKDQPLVGEFRANYEHIFDTTGWKLNVGGSYNMLYNNKIYDQYNLVDNEWVIDPQFSNSYDYREQIGALFTEVSKNWDKVGIRLGIRGEYTGLNGYSHSLEKQFIDSSYILPFPSASILFEPTEKVGLTFSYSSGIYRPQFSNYDPFVRIEDSLSISYGNPYLRPEYSHTVGMDLDLFYAYGLSVSYTYSDDPQSNLQFVDDSTFLVNSTPWNASHDQSLSVSLNAPLQFKWLTGWNSLWMDYSKYTFTPEFGRAPFFALTYGLYSYLTFRLPKSFNIMNRLHITKWGSAEMLSNTRVNWGLRLTKKMLNDKFQIYLDVSDIVPPKNKTQTFAGNFVYQQNSQSQFTAFKVGLFVKFGRLKQAAQIKDSSSGQSNRL